VTLGAEVWDRAVPRHGPSQRACSGVRGSSAPPRRGLNPLNAPTHAIPKPPAVKTSSDARVTGLPPARTNTNQDDWARAPLQGTRKYIGTRRGEWGSGLPPCDRAGSPHACPSAQSGTTSGRRKARLCGGRRGRGPAAGGPPRAPVASRRAPSRPFRTCRRWGICTASQISPAAVTDTVPAPACPLGRRGRAHLGRRSVDAQRIQSAKSPFKTTYPHSSG